MYEELTDFCGRDQIMQTPVRNLDFIVCAESSPWNIIREKECERIYIKKKKINPTRQRAGMGGEN